MKIRSMRSALPLVLALLAGSTLGAVEVSGGLQLSLAAPLGDLKDMVDSTSGADLKGFALLDLGAGHTIRPQADFLYFSGKPGTVTSNGTILNFNHQVTLDVGMASLGVDYLYFLQGDPGRGGFYGGAGIGLSRNQIKLTYQGFSIDDTDTKPCCDLVVGYQFNEHWYAEASYRYSKWARKEFFLAPVDLSFTLPAFLVGAGYRF